jgi:hypothetical protein
VARVVFVDKGSKKKPIVHAFTSLIRPRANFYKNTENTSLVFALPTHRSPPCNGWTAAPPVCPREAPLRRGPFGWTRARFLRNILTRKRGRKNVNRGLYKPKSRQIFTDVDRISRYIRIKTHFTSKSLQILTRKTNKTAVFSTRKGAPKGLLSLKFFTNGTKTTGKRARRNKSGARRDKSGTC